MKTITIKESIKAENIVCNSTLEAIELLLSEMECVLLHPVEIDSLNVDGKVLIDRAKTMDWNDLDDLK